MSQNTKQEIKHLFDLILRNFPKSFMHAQIHEKCFVGFHKAELTALKLKLRNKLPKLKDPETTKNFHKIGKQQNFGIGIFIVCLFIYLFFIFH